MHVSSWRQSLPLPTTKRQGCSILYRLETLPDFILSEFTGIFYRATQADKNNALTIIASEVSEFWG